MTGPQPATLAPASSARGVPPHSLSTPAAGPVPGWRQDGHSTPPLALITRPDLRAWGSDSKCPAWEQAWLPGAQCWADGANSDPRLSVHQGTAGWPWGIREGPFPPKERRAELRRQGDREKCVDSSSRTGV